MTEQLRIKQRQAVWRTVGILGFVIVALFSAIILQFVESKPDVQAVLEDNNTVLFQRPRLINDVSLTRHTADSFAAADFAGQWNVIMFGYTFCPDICAPNMADMNVAYQQLQQQGLADQVQFWMVTVDPERDTPAQLSLFVPYFNESFIGLTGSLENIAQLAMELSAQFVKQGDDENYTVAHSDNFAIVNPQGHLVALVRPPHKPSFISESVAALIAATP